MRIISVSILSALSLLQSSAEMVMAQSLSKGSQHSTSSKATKRSLKSIKYVNRKYGFTFSLPVSWKDYKILEGEWHGGDNNGPRGHQVLERGPDITIINPRSNSAGERQDIDIMVFTYAQWDALQQDKFFVTAASIGPSDIGRNKTYVFAFPPRMINDSLDGADEVMKIVQTRRLHAF